MAIASPFRTRPLSALALLAAASALPAACSLDATGLPENSGGGTGTSTSSSATSTGSTGTTTTSSSTGTGGSMMVCMPGAMQACYDGPMGTANVGQCKGGMATCNADGSAFGACMGEVTPAAKEDCETPTDDNCDGMVNEGCACTPGSTQQCYDGPMGTAGVGLCAAGMHTCNADGMSYGPCTGEVVPAMEDCSTMADEDCNGMAWNPLDTACGCVPGTMQACYDGPANTQGVGVCVGGMQTCPADGKMWGACTGEVVPSIMEDCSTPTDDDCNGKAYTPLDPACACVPGTMATCTTALLGVCAPGMKTCNLDGNSYAACVQTTQASFDDCKTAAVDEDCDGAVFACTGTPAFVKGGGVGGDDVNYAVAVDANGNSFSGGVGNGTVLNGFSVTAGLGTLTKSDPMGNVLWTKLYNPGATAGNYAVVRAVAVDSAGNVIVAGHYVGSIDLGNGTAIPVNGAADVFVAKYTSAGAFIWGKGAGDNAYQAAYGVAVDGNGDVFIVGAYNGNINFGGGNVAASGGGNTDIFVGKLKGSDGSQLWLKKFGDAPNQIAWAVATTPKNNVVVAGELAGKLDFGNGSGQIDAGANNTDAFVAKLHGSDGAGDWTKKFGDAVQYQGAYGIAVDPDPNRNADVTITGSFAGTIDFGGGTLTDADAMNNTNDLFVATLNGNSGGYIWGQRYGDNNSQAGEAVTVDLAGNATVTGRMRGTFSIGGANLANNDASNNSADIFVAKFAPTTGTPLWAVNYGSNADDTGYGIAADSLIGNLYVTGGFHGTMMVSGTTLTSAGGWDIFGFKLAP